MLKHTLKDMKTNFRYAAFVLALVSLLASCTQVKESYCYDEATRISVVPQTAQFKADGTTSEGDATYKAVVVINEGAAGSDADWDVTVDGQPSWVSVTKTMIPYNFTEPVTGKSYTYDEAGFEVKVSANPEYKRSFTLKVTSGNFIKVLDYVQLGAKADAKVTTAVSEMQYFAAGETQELEYTSNMGDVVSFSADYADGSSNWLSWEKSANGVKITAAPWTDKTKGRSATFKITVGTPETSTATATVAVTQLSADDVFYIWGGATKIALENSVQMDAVTSGICEANVQIYPSKGKFICINKNTRDAVYPVYYLAADGTIKESDKAVTSGDLNLDLVGLYHFTLDFNSMTWKWNGASKVESCMPDNEWSKYETKAYPAKGGFDKSWMTSCLHWDGGSYAKTMKLGCQITAVAGGGYGSVEPSDRSVPGTFDNVESGGTTEGLEAETNKYGRLYAWDEVLTGKCMGGCAESYDITAWPQEYCEGHEFVDAVGTKYVMPAGITALGKDDAALEAATPTLHMQIQGICPFGWHVANLQDYRDLFYAAYKVLGMDENTVTYETLTTGSTDVAALLRGAEGWTSAPDRKPESDAFGWNMYPIGRRLYKSGWSNYGVYFESWVCHPGNSGNSDHRTQETVYKVWRVVTTKATGTMKFNSSFDTGNGTSPIRCVKNYEID